MEMTTATGYSLTGHVPRLTFTREIIAALIVFLVSLSLFTLHPDAAGARVGCDYKHGLGTFGVGSWPDDCWRPYNDASPFNLKISVEAKRAGGQADVVSAALGGGGAAYLVAGDPKRADGIATFYPNESDPVYTLHCTEDWGTCPIEGATVHVPAGATPAGSAGTDAHMTLVDQESGWEYDLWAVQNFPDGGGALNFGWGGRTRIDGNGLDSYAVAARFGSLGGLVRSQELIAGHVDHALQMFVPCTEGSIYPADHGGWDCSDHGMPSANAPAMGEHFQLRISLRRIRHSGYPTWKRAMLVALHKYGAYVADTTGDPSYWGFRMESSATYSSFDEEDPMVTLAKSEDMDPVDYNHNGWDEYWFNLNSGVDWSRMQIVDSCAARGEC